MKAKKAKKGQTICTSPISAHTKLPPDWKINLGSIRDSIQEGGVPDLSYLLLIHKRHNLAVVWYGQIWEKYNWFGLFWPFWPSKTKFFHWIKFHVILSLWFKFGTILLAGSRENCSQGHKLISRLLAFEGRFSKNDFKFLTNFTKSFKFCPKFFFLEVKDMAFKWPFWPLKGKAVFGTFQS